MPLGSSSETPVMTPGPSRASSPASVPAPSVLRGGVVRAVGLNVVVAVELLELFGGGAGLELIAFRLRVHPFRRDVVGGGRSSLGVRFVIWLWSVSHSSPLGARKLHGQYHSRYLDCTNSRGRNQSHEDSSVCGSGIRFGDLGLRPGAGAARGIVGLGRHR